MSANDIGRCRQCPATSPAVVLLGDRRGQKAAMVVEPDPSARPRRSDLRPDCNRTARHWESGIDVFLAHAADRARREEIRGNLEARIIKARREGWLGEVEGLQVNYSGVKDKLAQRRKASVGVVLGCPAVAPTQEGRLRHDRLHDTAL